MNLFQAISSRNKKFQTETIKIITPFKSKLDEVVRIHTQDGKLIVEWKTIDIIPETDSVEVTGSVLPCVGEYLYLHEVDEYVKITEENIENYSKKIIIACGLKTLEKGTVEDIIENIKNAEMLRFQDNNKILN